jgi:hypothetical protein
MLHKGFDHAAPSRYSVFIKTLCCLQECCIDARNQSLQDSRDRRIVMRTLPEVNHANDPFLAFLFLSVRTYSHLHRMEESALPDRLQSEEKRES